MEKGFEKDYHELEESHFWFKQRRSYIQQLTKHYKKEGTKILDIGCSSGLVIKDFIKSGFYPENIYGIDISPVAIKNCTDNGLKNVFVMDAQEVVLKEKFDLIISSDCLEHLKDDEKALNCWKNLLKEDGHMIIFVPAFMTLWSHHDIVNMHYRRYTKTQLICKMKKANLKIRKSGYWNFFLFLPILLVKLLSRFSKKKPTTQLYLPKFNKVLSSILTLENMLLKRASFPFGISTFCIVSKEKS